jgi:hypothetical protein
MARLARQRLQLDRAIADFRHLALEQTLDHFRVRAAEDDLHRAGRVAHLEDQRLHALARVVLLAGDLLAARHDAFDAAEADDHRRAFEAGDGAGDDRADSVLVLFVNAAALVLAEELDHDLLDGLRADAAHDRQRSRLAAAGRRCRRWSDRLHGELAGVLGVELLAQPRGDRLLDVDVDLLALDVLVASDARRRYASFPDWP